jgi:hypothetical protein
MHTAGVLAALKAFDNTRFRIYRTARLSLPPVYA